MRDESRETRQGRAHDTTGRRVLDRAQAARVFADPSGYLAGLGLMVEVVDPRGGSLAPAA